MTGPPPDFAKPLSQKALRLLVPDLAGTLERVEQELSELGEHEVSWGSYRALWGSPYSRAGKRAEMAGS
jgi:hypothetical protein